jgi:GH18 family chitinase
VLRKSSVCSTLLSVTPLTICLTILTLEALLLTRFLKTSVLGAQHDVLGAQHDEEGEDEDDEPAQWVEEDDGSQDEMALEFQGMAEDGMHMMVGVSGHGRGWNAHDGGCGMHMMVCVSGHGRGWNAHDGGSLRAWRRIECT